MTRRPRTTGRIVAASLVVIAGHLLVGFLPRLLLKIAAQHPKLSVVVEVNTADRLLPLIETRELDLIFCAFGPDMADRGYVLSDIVKSSQAVVAAPSHPLASERSISLQRLTAFRCAGSPVQSYRNSTLLPDLRDSANLSAYMANDFNALIALASASDVVLIAPELVLQQALRAQTLVRLDVDWTVEVAYVAVATRAATYSPILNKIRGYAQELGEALRQDA